jgi:hypothetical protein
MWISSGRAEMSGGSRCAGDKPDHPIAEKAAHPALVVMPDRVRRSRIARSGIQRKTRAAQYLAPPLSRPP